MPSVAPKSWDEQLAHPNIPEIDRSLNKGIVDKVFSGASCIATVRGLPFHRAIYGQSQAPPPLRRLAPRALFDLGTLTRMLATQVAVLSLMGKNRLDIGAPIGRVLKDFEKSQLGSVPIDMLLDHTSGLPADAPLYGTVQDNDKRVSVKERRMGTPKALPEMRRNLAQLPLIGEPGKVSCVSNLGFMLLGWIVEAVAAKPLDAFLLQEVYKPLEIDKMLMFAPHPPPPRTPKQDFVSTELCPVRGHLLTGEVQDLNAWAMGGVAGHAGLFGTADAVWRLGQTLLDTFQGRSRVFHAGTLQRMWMRSKRVAGTSLTLGGWDTPARDNQMLNARYGHGSIGDISANGTSVWIDPVQNVVAVWLTNASHPTLAGKEETVSKMRVRYFELVASYATTAHPERQQPSAKVAALLNRIKKGK